MNNNSSDTFKIFIAIVILLIFIGFAKLYVEPSASEEWYQEHREEIDSYNEKHKDDWNGYHGTRRNSWAEDQELKEDGYDPDEYRRRHGY